MSALRMFRSALSFLVLMDGGFDVVPWVAHAQTAEVCDGLDNDGDGLVDEDFPNVGQPCLSGIHACEAEGRFACAPDHAGVTCDAIPLPPGSEGPPGDASCGDQADNDCDGLFDHADPGCTSPEICDSLDNDNDGVVDEDFPDLGRSCTSGVGLCRVAGRIVCTPDGGSTACSSQPLPPTAEGPAGSSNCQDGLDNDCDGAADVADGSCVTNEVCDEVDNDGDGAIDEDFPGVGTACSAGLGDCANGGEFICGPEGSSFFCTAVPFAPHREGPLGVSCRDDHDNDCDGLTDSADPDCGAEGSRVSCEFLTTAGSDGNDFNARYRFTTRVDSLASPAVTTTLLALDASGRVLQETPIRSGDTMRLKIRDRLKVQSNPPELIVEAPTILATVVAKAGDAILHGYCSPYPVLKVIEPDGASVAEGQSKDVPPLSAVIAATRVEPSSLHVFLDGVDLAHALGASLPGGPVDGTVTILGRDVSITDFLYDPAGGVIRFNAAGLRGGGHLIVATARGSPIAESRFKSPRYSFESLIDKGTIALLSLEIDTPEPGSNTPTAPVRVSGRVLHGKPIETAAIHGASLDTSAQLHTPGDGSTSADTYELPFAVDIPAISVANELRESRASTAAFNPGGNFLVARAADDNGIVVFQRRPLSLGPIASAGSGEPEDFASRSVEHGIPNAFVGLLSPEAISLLLQPACEEAQSELPSQLNQITNDYPILRKCLTRPSQFCLGLDPEECPPLILPGVSIPGPCVEAPQPVDARLCTPRVQVRLTRHNLDERRIACDTVLTQNVVEQHVTLPPFYLEGNVTGSCGNFLYGVSVDADFRVCIPESAGIARVSEEQLLNGGPIALETPVVQGSTALLSNRSDVDGLLGGFIDFFDFVNPFGDWFDDIIKGLSEFAIERSLNQRIGNLASQAIPPIPELPRFSSFGLREQIDSAGVALEAEPVAVSIEPQGVQLTYESAFSALTTDPAVPGLPISVNEPAPPPLPPPAGGRQLAASISDDSINQLLAAITTTGKLRLDNVDGRTFEDLGLGSLVSLPLFSLAGVTPRTVAGVRVAALIPPRAMLLDDPGTSSSVELGIRANDLLVSLVADRDPDGIILPPVSPPSLCIGHGAPTTGDCTIVEVCVDLNLLGRATIGTAPGSPVPEFDFEVTEIQRLDRPAGLTCLAARETAPPDTQQVIESSSTDPTLELLRQRLNGLIPSLAIKGLTFGDVLRVTEPALFAVETNGEFSSEEYLAIAGMAERANDGRPDPLPSYTAGCFCNSCSPAPALSDRFGSPGGPRPGPPGLSGFFLDFKEPGVDNHIEEVAVRVDVGGGDVIYRDFDPTSENDRFEYEIAVRDLPATAATHTVSGTSSGGPTYLIAPLQPGAFVLRGFRFKFANGDHHIRRIGIQRVDLPFLPSLLRLEFMDRNGDDPFDYEVSYSLVLGQEVLDEGQASGVHAEAAGRSPSPGENVFIAGFVMEFDPIPFQTDLVDTDNHLDRFGVSFGSGNHAPLHVWFGDGDARGKFTWTVDWVTLRGLP